MGCSAAGKQLLIAVAKRQLVALRRGKAHEYVYNGSLTNRATRYHFPTVPNEGFRHGKAFRKRADICTSPASNSTQQWRGR
jgi:hypothetical protein